MLVGDERDLRCEVEQDDAHDETRERIPETEDEPGGQSGECRDEHGCARSAPVGRAPGKRCGKDADNADDTKKARHIRAEAKGGASSRKASTVQKDVKAAKSSACVDAASRSVGKRRHSPAIEAISAG